LPFRSIAVLGPGLIGGSVLRAARERFPGVRLSAWARRREAVEELARDPARVDLASVSLEETVAGAELVVLAMPVSAMPAVAEAMPELPPTDEGRPVLVTDVGSVKGSVHRETAPIVRARGGIFVGSHPMAGSEKVGLAYAEAALFEGAAIILTQGENGSETGTPLEVDLLADFWQRLGGRVSRMEADRHDRLVAAVSHLPHLAAAALIRAVLSNEPGGADYCGGGLRDTTRVSAGPPEMWSGILADNREALAELLDDFAAELGRWSEALRCDDRDSLLRLLSDAKAKRDSLSI
jgi:prephenate dehydrogenase